MTDHDPIAAYEASMLKRANKFLKRMLRNSHGSAIPLHSLDLTALALKIYDDFEPWINPLEILLSSASRGLSQLNRQLGQNNQVLDTIIRKMNLLNGRMEEWL